MNTIASRTSTSKDVARIAQVSQATVSRVLSGHPNVQPETRERVLSAIEQTGYQVNGMAKAMRTNRTGNVGVVVSRLSNPLYPEMLQFLSRHLSAAGLRMVVWNTDERDDRDAAAAVRGSLLDGIIMTTATQLSTPLYAEVMMNAPVVLVHRIVDGWPCDQVESDNAHGAAQVADYLVKSGRRRIGLISGAPNASTIRDRQAGFINRLNELGYPLDPKWVIEAPSFSHTTGMEAAAYLLDLAEPPDTLFCVNDVLALGARDAARLRGVDVPGRLWLVGYDDIEMASWPAFDLTTVRQPLDYMAKEAVTLLRARINGAQEPCQKLRLPNGLVIRGSTAAFRLNEG